MNRSPLLLALGLALVLLALAARAPRPACAQAPPHDRFSRAAVGTPAAKAAPTASHRPVSATASSSPARGTDWWVAVKTLLLSALWWGKLALFCLLWYVVSWLLSWMLYRPGRPASAYGATRWAVVWAALLCAVSFYPLYLFTHWFWLEYWFMGGFFALLALILLISALTQPPQQDL